MFVQLIQYRTKLLILRAIAKNNARSLTSWINSLTVSMKSVESYFCLPFLSFVVVWAEDVVWCQVGKTAFNFLLMSTLKYTYIRCDYEILDLRVFAPFWLPHGHF